MVNSPNKKYVVTAICEEDNCEAFIYNMYTGTLLKVANAFNSPVTRGLVTNLIVYGTCMYKNNFCYGLFTTEELKRRIIPPKDRVSNTYNKIVSTFPDLGH